MNLESFTGPGSTPSRRRFWDKVTQSVLASQKFEGKNVSVSEHQGMGTVVNVDRKSGSVTPPPLTCIDHPPMDQITVTFSGIVPCPCEGSGSESFLGTDLGGLNASFVLPRIGSFTYQLSTSALYRVTKWSPNTNCTGDIEFEHESDCLVFASCNSETNLWTVAIEDQVDFFFAFFGQGDANPIAAEGVCDFPSSPDLFHQGTATIVF